MIEVAQCQTASDVRALALRYARRPVMRPVKIADKAPAAEPVPAQDESIIRVAHPQIRTLLTEVCRKYDLTYKALIGKRRFYKLVCARNEAAYLLREKAGLSLPRIGRILGQRDHTTVRHGIVAHARRHYLPIPENTGESWSQRLQDGPPPIEAYTAATVVLAQIAGKHSVTIPAMLGDGRCTKVVRAREDAARQLYDVVGLSSTQIGYLLNKHHTTILHALRRALA